MNKTILIISHVIPEPANSGDSLRVRNLIRFFKSHGYKIVCLFKGDFNREEVITNNKLIDNIYFSNDFRSIVTLLNKPHQLCQIMKRGNAKAYFSDLHLALAVKRLCRLYNPVVVMAEYIFMAPYLRHAPLSTIKIIDTIDVFFRKKIEVCDRGVDFPLACTKDEERKYLLYGNLILGIQPAETQMLKGIVPDRKVINVGVDMPCSVLKEADREKLKYQVILIVAGGNPNNVHGVNQFLRESWQNIYKSNSDVCLRVVGAVCKHIPSELVSDGVLLVGIVDDLQEEYRNADIVINPVVAGTGLKIKTIEAMSCGKAIVSTPNGVEGVFSDNSEAGEPFIIAKSSDEFVDKTLCLLSDSQYKRELERTVISYAKKFLTSEYVYKELKDEISCRSEILTNLHRNGRKRFLWFIKDIYACYVIFKSGCYDKKYYFKSKPNCSAVAFNGLLSKYSCSSNKLIRIIYSFLNHPVIHYVYKGVYEGKDLIEDFDSLYYSSTNSDVISNYSNPYKHYLTEGKFKGLAPTKDFVSVEKFCDCHEVDGNKVMSENTIVEFLTFINRKKTVLIVTHGKGGGANEYLYNVLVPDLKKTEEYIIVLSATLRSAEIFVFYDKLKMKFEVPVKKLFSIVKPDKIIINNLFYYKKDLRDYIIGELMVSRADIQVLFHDFFCVCPTVTLINDSLVFCGIKDCESCVTVQKTVSIEMWRNTWQMIFNKSSKVVFFSQASFELASKVFDLNEYVVKIEPHQPLISYSVDRKYDSSKNTELVVGIVGTLTQAKGGDIVVSMVKQNPKTQFVIIGSVINQYLKDLNKLENVIITGPYRQSELPDILNENKVTVTAITSVWPETFCYVLQELMLLEYPVVSFNLGAQGERVYKYKYGLVVDKINSSDLFRGIIELQQRGNY
jgi:glycosyltransferase involved in cell wall biosynthesis